MPPISPEIPTQVKLSETYVQTGRATIKRVGDRVALYVRPEKAIHVLNPWAEAIYRCLESPASGEEVLDLLESETGEERKSLEKDLRELLALLWRHRLIDTV